MTQSLGIRFARRGEMLPIETQELVRELITETDHLSRAWHEASDHTRAGRLAALRTTLLRLERLMGSESPRFALAGELDVVYQRIRDLAAGAQGSAGWEELERLASHASYLRVRPARVLDEHIPLPAPHTTDLRPFLALAVGTLAALTPLVVPALRRSRAAWGIAVSVAASSLALAVLSPLER